MTRKKLIGFPKLTKTVWNWTFLFFITVDEKEFSLHFQNNENWRHSSVYSKAKEQGSWKVTAWKDAWKEQLIRIWANKEVIKFYENLKFSDLTIWMLKKYK